MADQLSFRKSANIDRVTDKRKDSLFRLVDTDGSGTIDAQEFAVLYDAIKKDLAEELEKEAALEKEASSARRRFKMLLLFVAVLVSFLAASVAANFAVMFTVVDQAITTTTTSTGVLEVKGSDTIAKTAIATQPVPLMAAPVLDMETLSSVTSLQVTYSNGNSATTAHLAVVGVRKHNATFVEFVTDIPGETVEALNGVASLVRYPNAVNGLRRPMKTEICAANATCSSFKASGVDTDAAIELAKAELVSSGFGDAARRLQHLDSASCYGGTWHFAECSGSGCTNSWKAELTKIFYWTGYSGTRHVVFILHGIGSDCLSMWDRYCQAGASTCTDLTIQPFKHLVFVFPSAGTKTGNLKSWTTNLLNPTKFKKGARVLAGLMCGDAGGATASWGGACTTGWLGTYTPPGGVALGVGSSSQVMSVGFSNGGGMATYLNYVWGQMATKSIAIDYHAYHGPNWVNDNTLPNTPGQGFALKAYYACESTYYGTDLITTHSTTFPGKLSLASSGPPAVVNYARFDTGATEPFHQFTWTDSTGRYLIFAVHGLNPSAPVLDSSDSSHCTANNINGGIHGKMPLFVDLVNDIREWVQEDLPPPSAPPAPPLAQSPPPSPSPSPSPVVSPPPPHPSCQKEGWCCPYGYQCIFPFEAPDLLGIELWWLKEEKNKICVNKGGYIIPAVKCKRYPWGEYDPKLKVNPRNCPIIKGNEYPMSDQDVGELKMYIEKAGARDPELMEQLITTCLEPALMMTQYKQEEEWN